MQGIWDGVSLSNGNPAFQGEHCEIYGNPVFKGEHSEMYGTATLHFWANIMKFAATLHFRADKTDVWLEKKIIWISKSNYKKNILEINENATLVFPIFSKMYLSIKFCFHQTSLLYIFYQKDHSLY